MVAKRKVPVRQSTAKKKNSFTEFAFGELGTAMFRTVLTLMGGVTLYLITTTATKFETMERTLTMLNETVPRDIKDVKDDIASMKKNMSDIEAREQTRYIDFIARLTKIETLSSLDTTQKKRN